MLSAHFGNDGLDGGAGQNTPDWRIRPRQTLFGRCSDPPASSPTLPQVRIS
ncbi:hypothetical protein HFO26_35470 [Rhizobium leguminosarum]|nr:hypothetical protein [Rhizobium leguminosarum]